MIGCLRTRVHKQPIIVLYFEIETVLKVYKLGARPGGYTASVMLNLTEYDIYHAHKR